MVSLGIGRCILYSAICSEKGKECVCGSQNDFKLRMNGHFNGVPKHFCKRQPSVSFARFLLNFLMPRINNHVGIQEVNYSYRK